MLCFSKRLQMYNLSTAVKFAQYLEKKDQEISPGISLEMTSAPGHLRERSHISQTRSISFNESPGTFSTDSIPIGMNIANIIYILFTKITGYGDRITFCSSHLSLE